MRATGMQSNQRSSASHPRFAALDCAEAVSAERVSTAPRAAPVVPDVWMIAAASACGTRPARTAAAMSPARSVAVSRGCTSSAGTFNSSNPYSVTRVSSVLLPSTG